MDGHIHFSTPEDGPGLTIVDAIERKRVEIDTGCGVSPSSTSTGGFVAPVESAVSIDAPTIRYDAGVIVYVRDSEGSLLSALDAGSEDSFPSDTYVLELPMPMKVYLRVEGAMEVAVTTESTTIDLEDADSVSIGARSLHKHPAGTIETTAEPSSLRTAISHLSSALGTTSPERSFPTLRGHPPLIELGEELVVPPGIDRPETGIRIEVPDDLGSIFAAAPLAFYLGADLVGGQNARMVTDAGLDRRLGRDRPIYEDTERTLKQVFLLDCIVRTEGLYPVDLHERTALEPLLEMDLASMYDTAPAARLEAYLDVPYDLLEAHLPTWKSTVHVAPDPATVEIIPYALNDLATIRVESPPARSTDTPGTESTPSTADGTLYRSLSEYGGQEQLVEIQPTDAWVDTWFGDGIPVDGAKGSVQAYRNRLQRSPNDGAISVAVVQADPEMEAEASIDSVYGTHTDFDFEVTRYRGLSAAELRAVLGDSHDLLHFIGHVEDEGLQCSDGYLDTRRLDDVGIEAFLLNACHSYEQGRGLIGAGAVGGVVTIQDVVNVEAVRMGRTLARLMNAGFHLAGALDVAAETTVVGDLYAVIGDTEVQIAQTDTGGAYLVDLTPRSEGYDVEFISYPTTNIGLGSIHFPHLGSDGEQFLVSGVVDLGRHSPDELEEFLTLENLAFRVDGDLCWGKETELDQVL